MCGKRVAMKEFHVGDIVKCVDPRGELKMGMEYKVTATRAGEYENYVQVLLPSGRNSVEYYAIRFMLVKPFNNKELL
jgi:hypothetical protein